MPKSANSDRATLEGRVAAAFTILLQARDAAVRCGLEGAADDLGGIAGELVRIQDDLLRRRYPVSSGAQQIPGQTSIA